MKEIFKPKKHLYFLTFLFLWLLLFLSFSLYAAAPETAAPAPKKPPKQDPCAVCCGAGLCDPAVFETLELTPEQSKEVNMVRGQASQGPESLEKLNAKISELQVELLTLMSKSPDQLALMNEKIDQVSKAQSALMQKTTYTALQMLKVLNPKQLSKYWEIMGVKPVAAAAPEKGKEEKGKTPAPATPDKGKTEKDKGKVEGKKETK